MFILTLLLCSQTAYAQRGAVSTEVEPPQTASSGIAGFFDANTTQQKSLVFDFPTLTVDYGVTDNFTVGTNIISLFSLTDVVTSGATNTITFLNSKTRYRLFVTRDWTAALTGYLAFLSTLTGPGNGQPKTRQNIYLPGFTFNTARAYEGGSWGVSLARLYLLENKSRPGEIDYSSSERNATMISAWWRPQINNSIDAELLLATCPSLQQQSITSVLRLDTQETCFGPRRIDPLVRGMFSWRSSKQWLFSGGLIWIPGARLKYLPVLALNYLTEIFPQQDEEE